MHAAVALVAVVVAAPPAAEITTVKLSCAEQGVSRVPNRMSPPKAWRGVSTPLRSSEVKSEEPRPREQDQKPLRAGKAGRRRWPRGRGAGEYMWLRGVIKEYPGSEGGED